MLSNKQLTIESTLNGLINCDYVVCIALLHIYTALSHIIKQNRFYWVSK